MVSNSYQAQNTRTRLIFTLNLFNWDGAEQVKIYDKSASAGLIWRYARADLIGVGLN
jgi:hypothetical protein